MSIYIYIYSIYLHLHKYNNKNNNEMLIMEHIVIPLFLYGGETMSFFY